MLSLKKRESTLFDANDQTLIVSDQISEITIKLHSVSPSKKHTATFHTADTDNQTINTQIQTYDYEPGCHYEYFQGVFDELPNFSHLNSISGTCPSVSVGEYTEQVLSKNGDDLNGNFALRITGQLLISHSGTYTFYLGSNDGSVFYLASKKIIDHSTKHFYTEKSKKMVLNAGYVPFTVEFFHKNGKWGENLVSGPCLTLSWQTPNQPSKQLISNPSFSHKKQSTEHEDMLAYRNTVFDLLEEFRVDSVPEMQEKIKGMKRAYFMSLGLVMKLQGGDASVCLSELYDDKGADCEDTNDFQRVLSDALYGN